jgi:hypothetical protein
MLLGVKVVIFLLYFVPRVAVAQGSGQRAAAHSETFSLVPAPHAQAHMDRDEGSLDVSCLVLCHLVPAIAPAAAPPVSSSTMRGHRCTIMLGLPLPLVLSCPSEQPIAR